MPRRRALSATQSLPEISKKIVSHEVKPVVVEGPKEPVTNESEVGVWRIIAQRQVCRKFP